MDLILWNCSVAVAMIYLDVAFASVILIKDISITMILPPGAQLSIPATIKDIEEFWMLHPNH